MPAPHTVQFFAVIPSQYVEPDTQFTIVEPPGQADVVLHVMQLPGSLAPIAVENVPGLQEEHTVLEGIPVPVLNVPAMQFRQTVNAGVEYLPATHFKQSLDVVDPVAMP